MSFIILNIVLEGFDTASCFCAKCLFRIPIERTHWIPKFGVCHNTRSMIRTSCSQSARSTAETLTTACCVSKRDHPGPKMPSEWIGDAWDVRKLADGGSNTYLPGLEERKMGFQFASQSGLQVILVGLLPAGLAAPP